MFPMLIWLILLLCAETPGSYGNVDCEASSDEPNVPLPTDYVVYADVGVAYKFYSNRVSWNTARKRCAVEGASLATVDSFEKVECITEMVKNPFGSHTGIHRLFDGIEWVSSRDDQPLAFIPWKPDADVKAGTGNCVALWNDGSGVGPWDCNKVLPSVCEIPVFEERKTKPTTSRGPINPRIAN